MTNAALERFIERLSPHIDRLFIAGHRAARPYAAAIREQLGIPHFGVLIDLRKLLLSPTGMSFLEAVTLERYADPNGLALALEEHIAQGLLEKNGARLLPTARGHETLLALTDALARGVEEAWREDADIAGEAAGLADRVIVLGRNSLLPNRYPAFSIQAAGYLPPSPAPQMHLWNSLATLRYFRADAHALAWRDAGLETDEIATLTHLWRREDPIPLAESKEHRTALESLQQRGWAMAREGGWQLTPAGNAERERIETETNRLNAPPYLALGTVEREGLLARLAAIQTP